MFIVTYWNEDIETQRLFARLKRIVLHLVLLGRFSGRDIDRSRFDVGVAEHIAYRLEVRPPRHMVRREGMA